MFRIVYDKKDPILPYRVMKRNSIYFFTRTREEAEAYIEDPIKATKHIEAAIRAYPTR